MRNEWIMCNSITELLLWIFLMNLTLLWSVDYATDNQISRPQVPKQVSIQSRKTGFFLHVDGWRALLAWECMEKLFCCSCHDPSALAQQGPDPNPLQRDTFTLAGSCLTAYRETKSVIASPVNPEVEHQPRARPAFPHMSRLRGRSAFTSYDTKTPIATQKLLPHKPFTIKLHFTSAKAALYIQHTLEVTMVTSPGYLHPASLYPSLHYGRQEMQSMGVGVYF